MARKEPGAERCFEMDAEGNPLPDDQIKLKLISLEETEEYSFHSTVVKMYSQCPYLGYILTNIKRRECWDIPTAAISADNVMLYNPRFMGSLTLSQQMFVIMHEVLHKLNRHFLRGDEIMRLKTGYTMDEIVNKHKDVINNINKQDEKQRDEKLEDNVDVLAKSMESFYKAKAMMQLFNIAMDLPINELCRKAFEKIPIGVFHEEIEESYGIKLDKNETWEYYFNKLLKEIENGNNGSGSENQDEIAHEAQIGSGDGEGDGNDSDENGEGKGKDVLSMSKEEREQIFQDLARRALEKQKTWERQRGTGSFAISSILPNMDIDLEDHHLWKKLINKNFGHDRTNKFEDTLKRPNRRLPNILLYGKKRITEAKHCVAIVDTSGSCYDDLPDFFGAVQRACKKHQTSVDLLFCTDRVYSVYKNQRRLKVDNYKMESGGTDLTDAQDYIEANYPNEGRNLNVIVITDGYTPWKKNYKYNVSVIYTHDHQKIPGITNYAVFNERKRKK